jgi:PAS domain-containing protein
MRDSLIPDVYGVQGACELLGVSRQRLDVLRRRDDFPPRHPEVACWDGPALRAYATDRTDGRAKGKRTRTTVLQSYRQTGSYARAARAAGVHPATARAWLANLEPLTPEKT